MAVEFEPAKVETDPLATQFSRKVFYLIASGQRPGQARMNALATIAPELHEEITGTEADCYYSQEKHYFFDEVVYPRLQAMDNKDPWEPA